MAKKKKPNQQENKNPNNVDTKSDDKGETQVYEPKKSPPREVLEILLYGLCLLIFCKGFAWQNFQIPTASMENTLLIGDHITANMFMFKGSSEWEKKLFPFRDVKRGDVVVFKYPGNSTEDWIKRCIGVPGDRFELINDQVYINGEPLDEEYPFYKFPDVANQSDRDPDIGWRPKGYYDLKPGLEHAEFTAKDTVGMRRIRTETLSKLNAYRRSGLSRDAYDKIMDRFRKAEPDRIPEGFYFMMGDNRNRSYDSRRWGLVPKEFVQGRAYFVWWSYGEDENSHTLKGSELIWSYLRVPLEFFRRTHWEETFSLIK